MMGAVRGCNIPEDLYYNIESNVWVTREADGSVTVGLTSYACSLAGEIVAYTPKRAGKDIARDKSCATVESGKWVGPVKAPISGSIIAVNDAVAGKPGLINQDPYGDGWIVKMSPADWDRESKDLKIGSDAARAFDEKMDRDGFKGC